MHHCRSDGAKDQVDVRGMRGLWQQTLLDEGIVHARLKRTTLAEQLGAVAAAGLVPSELKVLCLGVPASTVCIRTCDSAAHIMAGPSMLIWLYRTYAGAAAAARQRE